MGRKETVGPWCLRSSELKMGDRDRQLKLNVSQVCKSGGPVALP